MRKSSELQSLEKPQFIAPFVDEIFFLERSESNSKHVFPFYANGFPGIVYSRSVKSFFQQPQNKALSNFYLFGQTIKPLTLEVQDAFELYVVQLYPFAVRILLDVDPEKLNDGCYDLRQIKSINTKAMVQELDQAEIHEDVIKVIGRFIRQLMKHTTENSNYILRLAINLIMKAKGNIDIQEIYGRLPVSERTLQRYFSQQIGITPKQFAQIIQFTTSKNQIMESDYTKLSDVGYENGYADQSHFIRAFKQYTGKTPLEFRNSIWIK